LKYTQKHKENMRKAQQERRQREKINKPAVVKRPVGRPSKQHDTDMIRLIMMLHAQHYSSRKIVKVLAVHGYELGYVTITKIIKKQLLK
jgi:hypothetical protein